MATDIIPGLPGGRAGIVLVLHHVVADGLRGRRAGHLVAGSDTRRSCRGCGLAAQTGSDGFGVDHG